MITLGLDTCLDACAAAVVRDGEVLARQVHPMARGHQERLAPLVRDTMAEAGLAFAELSRIGVTVGPGSFTGLRVGLAFAKGLSAALSVPAVGVGALEALAAEGGTGTVIAAIDAKRGQLYVQMFRDGAAISAPDALPSEIAVARLAEAMGAGPVTLIGSGAPLLGQSAPGARVLTPAGCDPAIVAILAEGKPLAPPRPLYLRAPDARLPGAA
jgi:tRNA threonylcarbamoyladenosine biosynthesis protein TsaB